MIDLSLDNKVLVTDAMDAAVQELDILFNTTPTELLGYTSYGTNWYQFLWILNPSMEDIKNYVVEKLSGTYFVSQMEHTVAVTMGDESSYPDNSIIVSVSLKDNATGKTRNKTYKMR